LLVGQFLGLLSGAAPVRKRAERAHHSWRWPAPCLPGFKPHRRRQQPPAPTLPAQPAARRRPRELSFHCPAPAPAAAAATAAPSSNASPAAPPSTPTDRSSWSPRRAQFWHEHGPHGNPRGLKPQHGWHGGLAGGGDAALAAGEVEHMNVRACVRTCARLFDLMHICAPVCIYVCVFALILVSKCLRVLTRLRRARTNS